MDIVEFLRARLDEDEAQAKHAIAGDLDYLPSIRCKCGGGFYLGGDAARVLREVEAKRRIMEEHRPHDHHGEHGDAIFCDACQWDHGDNSPRIDNQPVDGFGQNPCQTLVALAAIYVSHPDYDPDWQTLHCVTGWKAVGGRE